MNEDDILDVEQFDEVVEELLDISDGSDLSDSAVDENFQIEAEEQVDAEEQIKDTLFEKFSFESPVPVYLVDDVVEEEVLDVFSLNGTYPGSISSTYVEYFQGIAEKLEFNQHYLLLRSGQYAYTFAYGTDLELDGSHFTGNCRTVTIYRDSSSYSSDWYVSYGTDYVDIYAGSLFIYSDLGMYPTLVRGWSNAQAMSLLVSVCISFLFVLFVRIFNFKR